MQDRCHSPSSKSFADYGGRGISVCPQWRGREGFIQFVRDAGPRPSRDYQIDRIDNDGNYEPGNVRWVPRDENARNKRNNRNLTIGGVTKCLAEWVRTPGAATKDIIRARLDLGWTDSQAVFGCNGESEVTL